MAACGSLHPIFDNPLPESPTITTPWNQNESLTEIFRDLYFQDDNDNNNNNNNASQSSTTPPLPISMKHLSSSSGRTRNSRRYSFSNIYDEDETTSTDLPAKPEEEEEDDIELTTESNHRKLSRRRYRRSKSFGGTIFPPPISCLGRNGKPGMYFKYFKSDGRFIVKEVRIPNQDFLHVRREDGRLQLRLVHSESEDDDDEDDRRDPGVSTNNDEVSVAVAEEINKNE